MTNINNKNVTTFWNWFCKNISKYESILNQIKSISQNEINNYMDDFEKNLHSYNQNIWFRMGSINPYELIITAEGNINEFESIQLLINSAPKINNWKIIAFIQPQDISKFNYKLNDIELTQDDIFFNAIEDLSKKNGCYLELMFYVNDSKYINNDEFKSSIIRIAESGVGEFDFNTLLGFHDVLSVKNKNNFHNGLIKPIYELYTTVENLKKKLQR